MAFDIVNILDGAGVDVGQHLAGAWGPMAVEDLPSGTSRSLVADSDEICGFVIAGGGVLRLDDHAQQLVTGHGFTLTLGTVATFDVAQPTQLFLAHLPVMKAS